MAPLILLHGALGSAATFDSLRALLPDTQQAEAWDLPQHGHNTDLVTHALTHYADYFLQKIEAQTKGPVNLFGYSMGGYLALMMAARRPDLIGKVLTVATKFDWNPESGQKQIGMLNAGQMEAKVPAYATYLDSLHKAHSWKHVVGLTADILRDLVAHPPLQEEILKNVKNSCRIARGSADVMVSEEESRWAASLIPNADYLTLRDTPHPLEKIETTILAKLCNDFFAA